MSVNVALQPLTEADGPALAGLSYSSPDNGSIRYTANYQIDAVQAVRALHGNMTGVAAYMPGSFRLVGASLVRFGECLLEGALQPFAMLSNLVVHPDFRTRGVEERLVAWQMDQAHRHTGADGVILANYQHKNTSTRLAFGRWLKESLGPVAYIPMQTRAEPPDSLPGISAGPVDEEAYDQFACWHNQFYQDYNFVQPLNPASLCALTQRTPFHSPFRHVYAAVDARGELLAGLVAMEEYRLKLMEIRGLPQFMRLFNSLVKYIPQDGQMREVYIDHLWYRPGQVQAARHLVEMVQWIWASRATNISVLIDPRGALRPVFPTRPWSIVARTTVAAHSGGRINPRRVICPIY
jgi:GNAT superfamily N-acetyltransferase